MSDCGGVREVEPDEPVPIETVYKLSVIEFNVGCRRHQ